MMDHRILHVLLVIAFLLTSSTATESSLLLERRRRRTTTTRSKQQWVDNNTNKEEHYCHADEHSILSLLALRGGGGGGAVSASRNPFMSKRKGRKNERISSSWSSPSSSQLQRKIALALVFSALFNDTLQVTLLVPLLPTLVRNAGINQGKAEIAMGFFFASKDVFQLMAAPLAGLWTARVGCQTALTASTAALGLATLLFAHSHNSYWSLLMARSCQGAASAAILCAGLAWVAELTAHGEGHRGSAMGFATTGLALGVLCGPLAGGFLFSAVGQRATFQLAGVIVLLNAAAQLVFRQLTMTTTTTTTTTTRNQRTKEKANSTTQQSTSSVSPRASFLALIRNTEVMVATSSVAASYAFLGFIKPVSSMVLEEDFGMSIMNRSWVITIATAALFVGTPLAGILADKTQKSRLVAAGMSLMSLSSIFFAASRWLHTATTTTTTAMALPILCVAMSFIGFSLALQRSAGSSLLADLVDKHGLGSYSLAFAVADMADSLGLILGPVVGLTVSQFFGKNVAALLLGGSCLVLVPMLIAIKDSSS